MNKMTLNKLADRINNIFDGMGQVDPEDAVTVSGLLETVSFNDAVNLDWDFVGWDEDEAKALERGSLADFENLVNSIPDAGDKIFEIIANRREELDKRWAHSDSDIGWDADELEEWVNDGWN